MAGRPSAMLPDLAAGELTGSDLAIVQWTADPSPDGSVQPIAPLHRHRGDDEAWYVLDGSLGFSFDGDEFVVGAGGAALATAGTVHTYWNAGNTATDYLLIMTPRIRELIATLHDPGRSQGRSMAEIFEAFDSELVDP